MVPESAISKRPARSESAPVNEPLAWPNISLSKSVWARPPRLTITNGFPARQLSLCIALAISSLPVPFSPVMRTAASVGATRRTVSSTFSSSGLSPIIPSNGSSATTSSSRGAHSDMAVWTLDNRSRLSHGFVMKSMAPAFTPSTASGMLPQAVMRITGTFGISTFTFISSSRPSCPVVDDE